MAPLPDPDGRVQKSPFISISLDVLMVICDHLTVHQRISLALTEKCLLQALFPQGIPTMDSKLKIRLLLLLERDTTGQFCCFECSRLCYFNSRSRFGLNSKCAASQWAIEYSTTAGAVMAIPFNTARLIMLRHRQGSQYGLPKSFLYRYVEYTKMLSKERGLVILRDAPIDHPGDSWTIAHRQTANITNNELYIQRSHYLTGPPTPIEDFKNVLRLLALPVCNHLVCYRWWDVEKAPCVSRGKDPICHQHSGSCPTCFTDYSITVVGNSPKAGWSLLLETYHRLGSCSSPTSPTWRTMVKSTPMNEVIYFDDPYYFQAHPQLDRFLLWKDDYKDGMIESQWREAAGQEPLGGNDAPRKLTGWAFGCLGAFHLYAQPAPDDSPPASPATV